MIVKNEEDNLPACLESVQGLFGEVIIVDTGSTDRTKEIASQHGAKVFDFPWCDDFSAARNACQRYATGEWIFWMDADDRLDAANRSKLNQLLDSLGDENVGYVMSCLCLSDLTNSGATVVKHVRLFRNHPQMRWKYRVHEQIQGSVRQLGGQPRFTEIVIHHTGYQDAAVRRRKQERDLKLLLLDQADDPKDPFTLFNLGTSYLELGRPAEALPLLWRSLERSHSSDSIVRKLYYLIVQGHRHLAQPAEALAACQAGRRYYPDDPELLSQEGQLRRECGDLEGAEACLLRLLEGREGDDHFSSVPAGLHGYWGRHHLAMVYQAQGRLAEAEAQWHHALGEVPEFEPAWMGLEEIYLAEGRWEDLERAAQHFETQPRGDREAAVIRARGHLARQEFAAARQLLEETIAQAPALVRPRLLLTHVLLQEDRDPASAEKALREVLALDPAHPEARRNLEVLLRLHGRSTNGQASQKGTVPLSSTGVSPFSDPATLAEQYEAACRTPSDINEHCPTLFALARECRHVTEFGTRTGVSTTALLYAQPERLVCYDRVKFPQVEMLRAQAGRTRFDFHQADVRQVEIEETDLLFIDTWHVFEQLREELRRHAGKVRRYIALHDTNTFGQVGETEGHAGLWPAVEEFLAQGTFRLKHRFENNNGLAILERSTCVSEPIPDAIVGKE